MVPYQSTHNTGGTITGDDPKTSVVNRYLQAWEADNLFVMGASVFPQKLVQSDRPGRGARLLRGRGDYEKYIKNPGPLVHA